jgi:succinyl-diaminopimelate desuccinylase
MKHNVDKLWSYIEPQRVISFAQKLIKIPSENPPGNEKNVAELINEELVKIGFKTQKIEAVKGRPNIIGTINGTKGIPRLLLCGHSDVVPAGSGWSLDPYCARIIDQKLYGRGAADMKGGLAAMICAAESVKQAGIKLAGDLIIAVTVDEEAGGHNGMAHLIKNKFINADMAVVCEPSDFKLVLAEEGVLWIEVTTFGKAVHTLYWDKGINAIEKMCKFMLKLNDFRNKFHSISHEFLGSPILNIGTISGGSKTNIVPDTCRITIDMRLIPTQNNQEVLKEVELLINNLKIEDPNFEAKISTILSLESFESPKDSEIVRLVKLATKDVIGKDPDFWRRSTPGEDSDMLWLVKYGGIPSVYFGPGEMEQAHATNEHIEINDIISATKIYAHIIVTALGEN